MNEQQIGAVKKLTKATKDGKIKWLNKTINGMHVYTCTHDINYSIQVKYVRRDSISVLIECNTENPFTVLEVGASHGGPIVNHWHVLEPLANAIVEYLKDCARQDASEAIAEFVETL